MRISLRPFSQIPPNQELLLLKRLFELRRFLDAPDHPPKSSFAVRAMVESDIRAEYHEVMNRLKKQNQSRPVVIYVHGKYTLDPFRN
jgi:hypothetical protein